MINTKKSGQRPRGRPRGFDMDAALDAALAVFWRRGYDGAGIAELTEAMGISPPSLYAAFGDKRGLFLKALERYGAVVGAATLDAVRSAEEGQKVRALFDASIESAFAEGEGRGCFAACVAADAAGDDAVIRDALRAAFERAEADFTEAAGPTGPPGAVLLAAAHALAIRARAGASRAEVTRLARAMEAQLTGAAPR